MFNILLNNLSTVRPNVTGKIKYSLDTDEAAEMSQEERLLEGVYTNEPITHALVRKFVTEDKGEKLDLIYSLTTDTVLNRTIFRNGDDGNECLRFYAQYLDLDESEVLKLTHYEFYKELIQKIQIDEHCLLSRNDLDDQDEMEFRPAMDYRQISNNPGTKEIHSVVLAMATRIIELYDAHQGQCRLYMDYTGGDRTVSTVMIALTKMLEERGIRVDHIWAVVGFNSTQVNAICEKIEVNYIFDLISGLQEFNRYGKADILNEFLRKSEERQSIVLSEPARKVQEKIRSLADRIQLCRSGEITEGIGELVNAIKKYEKNDSVNDQMFNYLIADIKNNYAQIYEAKDRTIPNIISWCLDKSLIQQAVTMYAELLPQVLVESRILYYDRNGWSKVLQRQNGYEIYDNEVHNYIWYGTCDVKSAITGGKPLKTSYRNYKEEYSYINYYIWNEVAERAGYKWSSAQSSFDRSEKKADDISKYMVSSYSPYTQIGKGVSRNDLKGLLKNYMIFKSEIRHALNHAGGRFSLKDIHRAMAWMDPERIDREFEGNSDMTVQLLTEIMRDLLRQLDAVLEAG
ncbi:MAG: hypothetical protein LUI87_16985 [Lachnospiraceae bacterium]|nr:hypothetical protein [Lachnospiraceae bacterium]